MTWGLCERHGGRVWSLAGVMDSDGAVDVRLAFVGGLAVAPDDVPVTLVDLVSARFGASEVCDE